MNEETERVCRCCGVSRPIDQFSLRTDDGVTRRRRKCVGCSTAKRHEREPLKPEKTPQTAEEKRLKRKAYNLANREHNNARNRAYRLQHLDQEKATQT